MTRRPLYALFAAAALVALLSCTSVAPTGGGAYQQVSFSVEKYAQVDPDHYTIAISGNGVDIDTTGTSGDTVWFSLTPGTYSFDISAFDADDRLCGVASFNYTVTEGPQVIAVDLRVVPDVTSEPTNVAVTDGDEAVFSVAADGDSLSYQWQRDGSDVAGATDSSYTIASVSTTDSGAVLRCIVTNPVGSDTSAPAVLEVLAGVPVPLITTEPQDKQVTVGESAVFTLAADGPGLSYQWLRDGTVIDGAVDSSLRFVATAADSGDRFICIVANSAGTDTSREALLEVSDTAQTQPQAPSITTGPEDQVAGEGDSVVFAVAADGDSLSYQWQRDETDLVGPRESSYGLTVSTADSGAVFRCIVSNAHGSDTSADAVLRVFPADSLIDTLLVTAVDTLTAVRPYHVTGAIIVEDGGVLVVEAGAHVKMGEDVVMSVSGELRCEGTAQNGVTFTAYDTAAPWTEMVLESTHGAVFDGGGTYQSGCVLRYTTVEYADNYGLYLYNTSVFLDHCTFRRNGTGVHNRGDAVSRIEDCTVVDNRFVGIEWGDTWSGTHELVLLRSTIARNGQRGVSVYAAVRALIDSCDVYENLGGGIDVHRTDVSFVQNCMIRDNRDEEWPEQGAGLDVQHGDTCIVRDNVFRGNQVQGVGGGYHSSGGASGRRIVVYNLFVGNSAESGAAARIERPDSIAYNTFHDNLSLSGGDSSAVSFVHKILDGTYETSFMHNNVVEDQDQATYAVRNTQEEDGRTLNLRENWWGTDVEADIADMVFDFDDDSTYQRTDYSSFLSGPEPLAPAVPGN